MNNKIVAIGGGHGLSRVLSSLSESTQQVSAIVATTDNGGSTGKLRQEFGGIAFGDIRNCLSHLVDDNHLGKLLLDYRFEVNSPMAGHNLGNLMLLALDNLCVTPSDAIELLSRLLGVEQSLLPMSDQAVHLKAHYASGDTITGETAIDSAPQLPLKLSLTPQVPACENALKELSEADCVLIGPGSIMTSVMPSLLVPEIASTIVECKIPVLWIANLAKESSPIGALTLEQQKQFIESQTGVTITTVLAHGDHERISSSQILTPLTEPQSPYHHLDNLSRTIIHWANSVTGT